MPDVEMKPAGGKAKETNEENTKEEAETKPTPPTPVAEIKANILLIERGVSSLEPRFTHRVLRTLTSLRKRIDDTVLRHAIEEAYPKGMDSYSRFVQRTLTRRRRFDCQKNFAPMVA